MRRLAGDGVCGWIVGDRCDVGRVPRRIVRVVVHTVESRCAGDVSTHCDRDVDGFGQIGHVCRRAVLHKRVVHNSRRDVGRVAQAHGPVRVRGILRCGDGDDGRAGSVLKHRQRGRERDAGVAAAAGQVRAGDLRCWKGRRGDSDVRRVHCHALAQRRRRCKGVRDRRRDFRDSWRHVHRVQDLESGRAVLLHVERRVEPGAVRDEPVHRVHAIVLVALRHRPVDNKRSQRLHGSAALVRRQHLRRVLHGAVQCRHDLRLELRAPRAVAVAVRRGRQRSRRAQHAGRVVVVNGVLHHCRLAGDDLRCVGGRHRDVDCACGSHGVDLVAELHANEELHALHRARRRRARRRDVERRQRLHRAGQRNRAAGGVGVFAREGERVDVPEAVHGRCVSRAAQRG